MSDNTTTFTSSISADADAAATSPAASSSRTASPGAMGDVLNDTPAIDFAKRLEENDSSKNDPSSILSTLLNKTPFVTEQCAQTLGKEKSEELKALYTELSASASSSSRGVNPLFEKVVERYDAPHLYPVPAWLEGGVNCWTVYNLLKYAKAAQHDASP
ncbi:unnamed protein product [Amoebophrya sp. A25]|nr:unnamed protein product [Amoebophrya sp. A25]|eukprot:GSA25T00014638001.1